MYFYREKFIINVLFYWNKFYLRWFLLMVYFIDFDWWKILYSIIDIYR